MDRFTPDDIGAFGLRGLGQMDEVIKQALAAFQCGQYAPVVQFRHDGEWGSIYRVPVMSAATMEAVGDQFRMVRADGLRLLYRARLNRGGNVRDVMVVTDLPERAQRILDLSDGTECAASDVAASGVAALERRIGA